MNTTNRKSPMQSKFQNNNPWHSIFALPCIRPAAVPSLFVGLRSYHRLSPDSC
jgi:hypothetical protein